MKTEAKKIVVMGLGYIGLPTASLLATKGHRVLGVDVNPRAVETINRGEIHIIEPGLDILVKSAVLSGNLRASLSPEEAEVFIIAVPTPFKDNHVPDISHVEAATRTIAPFLTEGNLVILESTSPVGTTECIRSLLAEERPELFSGKGPKQTASIFIAHSPERVLPGHILNELVTNDRIIGGIDLPSREKTAEFYRSFVSGKVLTTDARTAELAKLTENSFRDVNIAFANELSLICDRLGINVWELIALANRHPRVNILQPGPGVGGHCIAVDPWFIVDAAPEEARLIRTARNVNDDKPKWVLAKVLAKAARFKEPVIGCLGLAFKANIDDLRESPALDIVRTLQAANVGRVLACDPNINGGFDEIPLAPLDQVVKSADVLLVLVDHEEFFQIDKELLKEKVVIDTRGVWR
jgi:UDP-N-acetyl-D-mannosaminuronic acid dehydrogenase